MNPIVYFLLALIQSDRLLALYVPQQYVTPEPEIAVYSSGGFSVSIPHENGIQLFSFHGSINKRMKSLDAGQFSRDVVNKRSDRWVYENRNTKLKEGDVIYFWFLVIKDNLGYRYDDGEFTVKDIVEKQPHNRSHASSSQPTTQSNFDDKTGTQQYSPMCELALRLSNTVDQLKGDVKKLKEINGILKNIVAENATSSTTLRFEGILPPFDDALYTVQIILQEKLGLRIPVVNATREPDRSITFQVASLDDKIYVIETAKEKLEKTKSKIILRY